METDAAQIVLIDCENVQPDDLGLLKDGLFRVKLFLGQNQTKIPVEWATALQLLPDVEYIRIVGTGRNALDFHIAFYLGELSQREPKGAFHIISKDKGFDPLIKHLSGKGVRIERNASIGAIQSFSRKKLPSTLEARIDAVVANLTGRKSAKPKKLKTLRGTIEAHFNREISEQGLCALVDELKRRGFIKVDGDKITYRMPSRAA
jgi:PIN domain